MVKSLHADDLYKPCPVEELGFSSTKELEPLDGIIGQPRALDSIRFAIGMEHDGYNLFAFGPEGTGKHSTVMRYLRQEAETQAPPPDWCYVNNFQDPHKPVALELPTGRAYPLRDDMDQLVEELQDALPAAFEGEDFTQRKEALEDELKKRHEEAFGALHDHAEQKNCALVRTPMGFGLAPTKDGDVLDREAYESLPEAEREQRKEDLAALEKELEDIVNTIPQWEKDHRHKMRELTRDVTKKAVGHLIEELEEQWAELENVATYLEAVREDVIQNAGAFLAKDDGQGSSEGPFGQGSASGKSALMRRYQVNVLVDNSERVMDGGQLGAPVIEEENPTQPNLVGRIEHISQMGALVTDFNFIKAGGLHRANGGYLVLDARRLLMQPFAWETLKRTLRAGHIRIESPAESIGWVSTVSLEPEPIPLDIKVVLLGEPMIYYLLSLYDPDFKELFKVAADFASTMNRDNDSVQDYARLLASFVEQKGTRHLEASGVARIVEQGARFSDDSERLTTHMASIGDLVREADYFAGQSGADLITAQHVQEALDAKVFRSDRYRERLQEEILRGTFVIETEGERIGQINGLSVLQMDSYAFGRPSRISATVSLGKGELIDIERQVDLGGPLHSKGVMILESFLSSRYGQDGPMALSASIAFEQSYGGVEGDSASSAELYALLSAIGKVPLKQSIAVTGSVDQAGRVQAIGGVNEKIEGFFDICAARGLDGSHGVIIPVSNVKHLMLRQDVIDAVRGDTFRIWAVGNVDEALEILTGLEAGEKDTKGGYPHNSLNAAVMRSIRQYAGKARMFAAGPHPPTTNAIIKVQSDPKA